MNDVKESKQETPRRDFIGQIAASALIIAGAGAGAGCGTPAAAASLTPASGHQSAWDDSWTQRLKARHKAVFDSPEIDEGRGFSQATSYVRAMHDVLGSDDAQTVVVVRHHAIPLIFNDAMWKKYPIAEDKGVKDRDGRWETANPYTVDVTDRLLARGHIVLGCDMATRNYAGVLAGKTHGERDAIYDELKANLIAGVILQPTGVYAAHRAQEAGCTYIRST